MHAQRARFGGPAPAAVDQRLVDAAASYADGALAETLLLEAHTLDPSCLPVYFALYKFYFYKSRLADRTEARAAVQGRTGCGFADAERIALAALDTAASQAGMPADWRQLTAQSANWTDTRGPQHFYLFSLKALAFIRLRRGRADTAQALLAKLAELDPSDTVGGSVIGSLAAATRGAA